MFHIHVGWDEHLLGARNRCKGEYDSCRYSVLIVGVPVYFSFQGCFHVIDKSKLKTQERREQMLTFVQTFLVAEDLGKRTLLPLKPIRELKRTWFYQYFLWLFGLTAVPAVSCLLFAEWANPGPNNNIASIIISWFIVILLFLSAILRYLLLRKPSPSQGAIRRIVASRLGPFSDPADWARPLAADVALAFGITNPTPAGLIQKSEQLFKQEHHEDALIAGRLALALLDAPNDLDLAGRADSITERCLRSLAEGS